MLVAASVDVVSVEAAACVAFVEDWAVAVGSVASVEFGETEGLLQVQVTLDCCGDGWVTVVESTSPGEAGAVGAAQPACCGQSHTCRAGLKCRPAGHSRHVGRSRPGSQ